MGDVKTLGKNSYCVSAWRVIVGYTILQRLMTVAGSLITRPMMSLGVVTFRKERRGRWFRITGDLNISRMTFLLRKLRPFKRVIVPVLPVLIRKGGPRLMRTLLIKPEKMSTRDISLIVPKTPGSPALILVKWKQHRRIDFEKISAYASSLFEQMDLRALLPDFAASSSQGCVPFTFDVRGGSENLEPQV